MIVQITIVEGGKWFPLDWDKAQHFISDYPGDFFTAIRVGDNIYDFVLARLGLNPWRRR